MLGLTMYTQPQFTMNYYDLIALRDPSYSRSTAIHALRGKLSMGLWSPAILSSLTCLSAPREQQGRTDSYGSIQRVT